MAEKFQPGKIAVHTRGADGRPVKGATCDVSIQGPNGPIEINVEDQDNGTFNADYNTENLSPGEYKVKITIDDEPLIRKDDCYNKFRIFPPIDPGYCYAKGPGLKGKGKRKKKSGKYVGDFTIYSCDSNGNPTKGSKCTVNMQGPNGPVDVLVKDLGDGRFFARYNMQDIDDAGPGLLYSIDVLADNQPIKDSPFTFKSKKSKGNNTELDSDEEKRAKKKRKRADPSECYAEGDGLKGKGKDGLAKITVHCLDEDGNPVKNSKLDVGFRCPRGATPGGKVKNNGDGTWTVEYAVPKVPGDYEIDLKVDGKPIKNGVAKFAVADKLAKAIVEGPGLAPDFKSGDPDKDPTAFSVRGADGRGRTVPNTK